ncbi:MAG: dTMP kinase [Kangiellaceae bacterium]|jgi:dTMP kinase|nr:dTMP kinase [Kangiellaceae bacterium]
MAGKFISIEGGEGVGKSTNLALVESMLKERSIPYLLTREPGGTEVAEEVRELLLAKRQEKFSEKAELLCMFAAREQHVSMKIKPALDDGTWVISDRFTDASFAYQGGGRGIDWQQIELLEHWTLGQFKPDRTLLLDVDPSVGMARAEQRGELDRFESEKINFFHDVRAGYLRRVKEDPERFILVDAGQTLDRVQHEITTKFGDYLDSLT